MIVVDASAILAILLKEPEVDEFKSALLKAGGGLMSPINHWEVLVRADAIRGPAGRAEAETILGAFGVRIVAIDDRASRAAADAFRRYGKRTPARLNLGDCFAYALASSEGDGLLFKGDDFSRTDIARAG